MSIIETHRLYSNLARLCTLLLVFLAIFSPARAAEPIRIGLSVALTGPVAANGKQVLLSMQVWKDDTNARGGLLGRPVEFVYYDDQSNPSLVPGSLRALRERDWTPPVLPVCLAGQSARHRLLSRRLGGRWLPAGGVRGSGY